jgi:hypothetical protein
MPPPTAQGQLDPGEGERFGECRAVVLGRGRAVCPVDPVECLREPLRGLRVQLGEGTAELVANLSSVITSRPPPEE